MVVAEALELATVCLTGAPDVAHWVLAVSRGRHPVDDVVLGLVLQAAVMVESLRPGAVQDVVLEQVLVDSDNGSDTIRSEDYLAGRDVTVEELRAAVVGPAIPQQVVIHSRYQVIYYGRYQGDIRADIKDIRKKLRRYIDAKR